jgi:hypothetical protein
MMAQNTTTPAVASSTSFFPGQVTLPSSSLTSFKNFSKDNTFSFVDFGEQSGR